MKKSTGNGLTDLEAPRAHAQNLALGRSDAKRAPAPPSIPRPPSPDERQARTLAGVSAVTLTSVPLVVAATDAEFAAAEAPSRPRVASEALHDAAEHKEAHDVADEDGGRDEEDGDGEDGDGDGEEEEEDSDDEGINITPGLNINFAEDQVPSREESGDEGAPQTSWYQHLAEVAAVDDDDGLDDDLELLLPPPKRGAVHASMSMRTLRRPSEVGVVGSDTEGDRSDRGSTTGGEGGTETEGEGEGEGDGDEDKSDAELREQYLHMAGYIRKLPSTKKLFASAHRRWFILHEDVVSYCVASTSQRPRRLMQLTGARCDAFTRRSGAKQPPTFEVHIVPHHGQERRLITSFDKREDALAWHGAVSNNVSLANEFARRAKAADRVDSRRTSHVGHDLTERPREMPRSYYQVLGVPEDATAAQIRKTYYGLAKRYHPDKAKDKNPDEDGRIDTKAFSKISQAYEVLKDAGRRKSYNLGETVKAAFRLGVLATKHDAEDSTSTLMAFFLDRQFENLFWQAEVRGSVLKPGYSRIELRYVHRIFAGEEDQVLRKATRVPNDKLSLCLSLHMSPHYRKQGYLPVFIELDTQEARDDMLDGLRILRCGASMLFQQNLDAMKSDGMR